MCVTSSPPHPPPQGHAGYGLMYLWAARLIAGHAGGAAVTGGPLSTTLPSPPAPSSPPTANSHLYGPTWMALPVEYHHFVAPGLRTSPLLAPYAPALVPWLICAVRRARRAPGSPSCAALSLGWTAAFLSQPAAVPDVKAAMQRV